MQMSCLKLLSNTDDGGSTTIVSCEPAVLRGGTLSSSILSRSGLSFPVIDSFDNHAETAYTGWPDRLYLVARGGEVLYKSKPGHSDFILGSGCRPQADTW
jgi:hypothetical protein